MSLKRRIKELSELLKTQIWQTSSIEEKGLRGTCFALLRILSIIWHGCIANRIPSQAAALSYYSLIGLGPLLAILIMVSGYMVKGQQDDLATQSLGKVISFIAPSTAHLKATPGSAITHEAQQHEFNPQLMEFVNNLGKSARSGTAGIVGTLILILICIQLIITIENTLNMIWGVRRGRSWGQRIVSYWTLISLGTVLGIMAITFLSAATLSIWIQKLPFGLGLAQYTGVFMPVLSFTLIILLFALFYRFIPHTTVPWKAAFIGSTSVAVLLFLNNYLSFLYISRVVRTQSLYGSIGIVPVLMFGLFIFWIFILLGGQITYSVQNVKLLTNLKVWKNISVHARESLTLTTFLLIARRFYTCAAPLSSEELSNITRVPGQVLNESILRLHDMGLISPIESVDENEETITRYQPSKPLSKITLGEFKQDLDTYGADGGAELLCELDPILGYYEANLQTVHKAGLLQKPVKELFEKYPVK